MSLYQIILHTHSVVRYIALITIILAIANSLYKKSNNLDYLKKDKLFSLLALASFHFQFLIGFILYFLSPKVLFQKEAMHVDVLRFYTVEHIFMMVIAFVLITIGYSKSKKLQDVKGHKTIFLFYLLALIIVFLAIPWPFRTALGGGWF